MARRKVDDAPMIDSELEIEAGAVEAPAEVEEKSLDQINMDANRMATAILRKARNADVTDALNGKIAQLKRKLALERLNQKGK